jgi:AcrR family transcriptional regulator
MSGDAQTSRPEARRNAVRNEILDAAWELVREQGLSGLRMRDLGARVGMRAQSLYGYFDSKFAIYDAMFAQGYAAFAAAVPGVPLQALSPKEAEAQAREEAHRFFDFCVADPVRFQLLFLRTIPGFQPSAESYGIAIDALNRAVAQLQSIGVTDPGSVDLWTAVVTGLASQQIANDPGGDRWKTLVDRAVAMLFAATSSATSPRIAPPSKRRASTTKSTQP